MKLGLMRRDFKLLPRCLHDENIKEIILAKIAGKAKPKRVYLTDIERRFYFCCIPTDEEKDNITTFLNNQGYSKDERIPLVNYNSWLKNTPLKTIYKFLYYSEFRPVIERVEHEMQSRALKLQRNTHEKIVTFMYLRHCMENKIRLMYHVVWNSRNYVGHGIIAALDDLGGCCTLLNVNDQQDDLIFTDNVESYHFPEYSTYLETHVRSRDARHVMLSVCTPAHSWWVKNIKNLVMRIEIPRNPCPFKKGKSKTQQKRKRQDPTEPMETFISQPLFDRNLIYTILSFLAPPQCIQKGNKKG